MQALLSATSRVACASRGPPGDRDPLSSSISLGPLRSQERLRSRRKKDFCFQAAFLLGTATSALPGSPACWPVLQSANPHHGMSPIMAWANSLKINPTPPLCIHILLVLFPWGILTSTDCGWINATWPGKLGHETPGRRVTPTWAWRDLLVEKQLWGAQLMVWAPRRALTEHRSLSQKTLGVGGSFYFRLKPKGMLGRDLATLTAESHADPSPWWFYTCQQGFGGVRPSGLGKSGMPWGLDFPWELLMSMKKTWKNDFTLKWYELFFKFPISNVIALRLWRCSCREHNIHKLKL